MRRKSNKFHLFGHIKFACQGFKNMVLYETAAKIHLVSFIAISILLPFAPIALMSKLILFSSMLLIFIGEAINTAFERLVDLASPEYHELAMNTKDIAALVVLLFFLLTGLIWLIVLLREFNFI